MKRICLVFFLITFFQNIYGNDTTAVRISSLKSLSGSTNWQGVRTEIMKKALFSMDSMINGGTANADVYFNRGALKEAMEDKSGALKDYNKAISIDDKIFGALVNRSILLMNQKDYSAAMADMNKVIALYPNESIAYNNRGFLLQAQKKYDDAIKDYSKSFELDKGYINPFVNKIRCYILLKKFNEAKALCDELLIKFPNNPGAFVEVSDFNVAFKNLDAALYYLDMAVKASNRDPEMYIARSTFKDDVLNEDEWAIKDCDTAILLDPQSPQGYFARCRPLFDLKQFDRIIADCNKAISLDSTFYEAYVMRGDANDLLFNTKAAIKDYENAIRLKPNRDGAYIQLEVLYTSRNDFKNGLLILDRLLKMDPSNQRGLFQRAHLNLASHEFKSSKEDFITLTKLFPDNAVAFYFLGITEDSLGEQSNACKHMKISDELDAEEARSQHALTEAHEYMRIHCRDLIPPLKLKGDDLQHEALEKEMSGDFKGSIEALNKLIELFPDSAIFYYGRGKCNRKMNNFELAVTEYKKAIKLDPNFPDALVSMGVALQKLERTEEALAAYKKTIEISPGNEMPYNNIAVILMDEKKFTDAIPYLIKAIGLKNDYLVAIMHLGECYEALSDKKNACLTYKKAEALGDGAAMAKRMYNCY